MSYSIAIFIITKILLGIRKIQAVAVPAPMWEVAEAQGPVMGIPLGSSEGRSRQHRWGCHGWVVVHSAHHSAQNSSTQLCLQHQMHSGDQAAPAVVPCVREGGLGEGKSFGFSPRDPSGAAQTAV